MRIVVVLCMALILGSCATKIPYTKKIKEEFSLDEDKLKKVQFYTSETIILERSNDQSKISTTSGSGKLVSSERASSERIIIPANRPCIFDGMDEDGNIQIRFEMGARRVLRFTERENISNGRLYLKAEWENDKGELEYGGAIYYAVRGSASAYLLVKIKNFKKNQHNDRVIKGMKVK